MGQRVEVDGRSISVDVRPGDLPPVVFVAGLNDPGSVWERVLKMLPGDMMTVTYDRPGLGDSDPLPDELARTPRGYAHSADELHKALAAAEVRTPYILVGHSLGGLVAQVYTAKYLGEVAGLVLVDATEPRLYIDVTGFGPAMSDNDDGGGTLFDWRAGWDDLHEARVPRLPTVVIASAVGRWSTAQQQEKYAPYTMADVDERWQRWQRSLADELGAVSIVAGRGGHYVHTELPALVARSIEAVVNAVRGGTNVRLGADVVEEAGGAVRNSAANAA